MIDISVIVFAFDACMLLMEATARCAECRRKVGLTGIRCRCGNVYCSKHRYSDKHSCSYDWKANERAQLTKALPHVGGAKITKI
jgi:predicted nucleic acid binding AN1-type Zn finger protein